MTLRKEERLKVRKLPVVNHKMGQSDCVDVKNAQ